MSTVYTFDEALNYPQIPKEWAESIVVGSDEVCQFISDLIVQQVRFRKRTCVLSLDGFLGVEWENIVVKIRDLLGKQSLNITTIDIASCYKSPAEIEEFINPCLNNDPDFGFVFKGRLQDFFDLARIEELKKKIKNYKRGLKNPPDVVVCYGTGAVLSSLRNLYDLIFYVDITREELLKRCEKRVVFPPGSRKNTLPAHLLPRRLSYVDYQVLKIHKKYVLEYMDWYVEGNIPKKLKLLSRKVYEGILSILAQYPFRLKPIYIPRIWGGEYLKKIRKLPKSMPGCAFALEVIPSEQNLRISVGKTVLEIPFLNLLCHQPLKILGNKTVKKFGEYFPLTVNYDDTYQGGNMAIQVHPDGAYMRKHFNEFMRHDETYYVAKIWPGARTYHGLKERSDLGKLRQLCKKAEKEKIPFNQDLFINSWPSKVGDLFLIPAGTIHASGRNQLVIEIDMDGSKNGTEYTFHLYDYLRPDLNGNLRAIHLNHAFSVIKPYRKTNWVGKYLKQSPKLIRSGEDWAEYLLGERKDMCYKVHRLEFIKKIDDDTRGKFHILILVEGDNVIVKSQEHPERQFKLNFSETIIVPACFGKYSIINLGNKFSKLVKALLK